MVRARVNPVRGIWIRETSKPLDLPQKVLRRGRIRSKVQQMQHSQAKYEEVDTIGMSTTVNPAPEEIQSDSLVSTLFICDSKWLVWLPLI